MSVWAKLCTPLIFDIQNDTSVNHEQQETSHKERLRTRNKQIYKTRKFCLVVDGLIIQ